MGKNRDYIPGDDDGFNTFVNNMYAKVMAKKGPWNIPTSAVNQFINFLNAWNPAYALVKDPNTNTRPNKRKKNTVRKALQDFVRQFVKQYLAFNPAVKDNDKKSMKLTVPDKEPTDRELPDDPPDIELKKSGVGYQKIHAQNFEDPDFDGVPDEVSHIRAAWHIGDDPPVNPRDFSTKKDFSTALFQIDFKPEDSGKKVHIAIRYIGHRGQEGKWSKKIAVGIM